PLRRKPVGMPSAAAANSIAHPRRTVRGGGGVPIVVMDGIPSPAAAENIAEANGAVLPLKRKDPMGLPSDTDQRDAIAIEQHYNPTPDVNVPVAPIVDTTTIATPGQSAAVTEAAASQQSDFAPSAADNMPR